GANSTVCRHFTGSAASCAGWVGVIVATATNDWVWTCDYMMRICIHMKELYSRGFWADCEVSQSLYHCKTHDQVLSLPAYVQTSRALMVLACVVGCLPAALLVLMSMPCVPVISLRVRRVHHLRCNLSAFVSSPAVGSALCLLGGSVILCCHSSDTWIPSRENSFFYSRQQAMATAVDAPANHAKSAQV
uniref:Uncharacterized protein n=1 Tax=Monopterus albus TaxID=43700 RepID=A0A3Q3K7J7_MONAL